LEDKEEQNTIFDIPVAQRIYYESSNSDSFKKLFFISPVILLLLSLAGLIITKQLKFNFIVKEKNQVEKIHSHSILGHLPYDEIAQEKLVYIEPNIRVHIDMSKSLMKMKRDAREEGIYLVFLSGYRSKKLQEDIFYSLKSLRNQVAAERARVSAPPGYSEHSTGFAIDIGDANNRNTDFEVEFEKTEAFKWLKDNAAKYHFRLSFSKDGKYVDYEPWHWRYEGSIEALKIFESSNRRSKNYKD